MLVEDNDLDREVTREFLEERGANVNCAENGVSALNMLKHSKGSRYNLILMDIKMPLLDGFETTEQIRELSDRESSQIPIIAMTADGFDEGKKRAQEVGMNAYMVKPLDMIELKENIYKLLDEKAQAIF